MKKQMTIGKRLYLGFGFSAIIMILLGIIAVISLNRVNDELSQVANKVLPFIQNLLEIRIYFTRIDSAENSLLTLDLSLNEREERMKQFEEDKKVIDQLFASVDALEKTEEEKKMWEEFKSAFALWWQDHEKFVELVKEFQKFGLQNPTQLEREVRRFTSDHYKLCNSVREYIMTGKDFQGGDDHTACNFGKWLTTFKTDNSEINSVLEQIKVPHQKFHEAIKNIKSAMAQGDKDTAIQILSNVEEGMNKVFSGFDSLLSIADKANEAYHSMSNQALVVNYVNYSKARDTLVRLVDYIEKISEAERTSAIRTGSIAILAYTIIAILGIAITIAISILTTYSLNKILKNISSRIKDGTVQVSSAGEQVSQASQTLSTSASESASSIEETSASVEELTSMIQQNAGNATQCEQIMANVQHSIINSVEAMNKLLENMQTLQQASANTAGIIKTIDEIAFQTNLLALNAAVEAARAGEAGKGFAVVAEEVRRLAQRSAEAAKNTQQLIEDAMKRSDESAKTSKEVGELLVKTKELIEKVQVLVKEISTATNEQAKGMEQINTAIMEINKATQEVAASSEESASASEELSAQAEELLNLANELESLLGKVNASSGGVEIRSTKKSFKVGKAVKHEVPEIDRRKKKPVGALSHHIETKESGAIIKPEEVIPLDDEDLKEF